MLDNLIHWLSMGGYSIYVWPAYGLVFAMLVVNILGIKTQNSKSRKKLLDWIKRQSQ